MAKPSARPVLLTQVVLYSKSDLWQSSNWLSMSHQRVVLYSKSDLWQSAYGVIIFVVAVVLYSKSDLWQSPSKRKHN